MSRSRINEENNTIEFLTANTTNMRVVFEHIAKVYETGDKPPSNFICSFLEDLDTEGVYKFNLKDALKLMQDSKPSDENYQEFTKFKYWNGGWSWWSVSCSLFINETLRNSTILKEKARFIRTVILPKL